VQLSGDKYASKSPDKMRASSRGFGAAPLLARIAEQQGVAGWVERRTPLFLSVDD